MSCCWLRWPRRWWPEELLSFVENKGLRFEPGSRYHYSNSDNVAVALIVESVAERSYEGQLQEQVYVPLGLTETSLPRGANRRVPFNHGYGNDPSEQLPKT